MCVPERHLLVLPLHAPLCTVGLGLAAPVLGAKPDTWSSWRKLSDAVVRDKIDPIEPLAVQGSGSFKDGPVIGDGSGSHEEELELKTWEGRGLQPCLP